MRKFDQYKGVADIISKIREMAAKSSEQHIKDLVDKTNTWYANSFESDPLGRFLPYLSQLSPQLKKDLSKVEFDWENYTSATDLVDMAWRSRSPDKTEFGYSLDIMGPHNRMGAEGVSWIGCAAGGDWEEPVFFMLYMDQGQVRVWIPKEGNCWNRTIKQAFGNDDDSDPVDIKQQIKKSGKHPELLDEDFNEDGFYDYVDYLRDSKVIAQNIKDHFEPRPHVIPKR
ncbi:MAG: hypothetical protein ACXAC5_05095 [Promethearchaeota archaeon]|jgi:hypothetical protein